MKTSFKVVSLFSVLSILSGCPDKGGGSKEAQPPVTVPGMTSDRQCTAETKAAYDNIYYNRNLNTECPRLQNLLRSESCKLTTNQGQVSVISYNDQVIQNNCRYVNGNNGIPQQPGYPNQPGYPQPGQGVATKNVLCSIDVTSGSAAGTVSNMDVKVFANGSNFRLYANMQNTKTWGGFINYTKTFSSEKLATLGLKYKAGNTLTADTLTLSADLRNGKSVTATSFAGSEVRIEIASDNEYDTSLVVSCLGQDQFNAGPTSSGRMIRCSLKENADGKITKLTFLDTIEDLINLTLTPSKNSNLTLEGSGQNILSTSVAPSSYGETYKVITSLISPSTVTIKDTGYSSTTNCVLQ